MLFLVVVIAGAVFYYAYALRYVYRYYLGPDGLEGRWFGIQTMFVRYDNVEDVQVVSFWDTMNYGFRTVRAGNRFGGPVVVVKQRSAFRKIVLLTPDDGEKFAGELRRRVAAFRQ